MVRRPLLEPNLSPGGLTFIGVSLLVFLMANVVTKQPTESDLDGARRPDAALSRSETPDGDTSLAQHGPGYPLLHLLASHPQQDAVARASRAESRHGRVQGVAWADGPRGHGPHAWPSCRTWPW